MNSFKTLLLCWLFGCKVDYRFTDDLCKSNPKTLFRCNRCERLITAKKFRLYKILK